MEAAKRKILVADDEDAVCRFMTSALEPEGFEVVAAADGEEALAIARDQQLDLIFLDVRMPQLDGVGFLSEFNRLSRQQCPIIAITGYDDDDSVRQCFDQGVYALVRKPLRSAEVIALCKRYTADDRLIPFAKRLFAKYPQLTSRELEVARLVRQGLSNKEIAEDLIISLSTVEFHRNNLRDKMGLKRNRTNLRAVLMSI